MLLILQFPKLKVKVGEEIICAFFHRDCLVTSFFLWQLCWPINIHKLSAKHFLCVRQNDGGILGVSCKVNAVKKKPFESFFYITSDYRQSSSGSRIIFSCPDRLRFQKLTVRGFPEKRGELIRWINNMTWLLGWASSSRELQSPRKFEFGKIQALSENSLRIGKFFIDTKQ